MICDERNSVRSCDAVLWGEVKKSLIILIFIIKVKVSDSDWRLSEHNIIEIHLLSSPTVGQIIAIIYMTQRLFLLWRSIQTRLDKYPITNHSELGRLIIIPACDTVWPELPGGLQWYLLQEIHFNC